jgi:TonB family protein
MPARLRFGIALLLCAASVGAQDTPASAPPPFVSEGDTYGKISIRDGVFEITQSTGFLRTRQVHSDFTLSAQFRLIDDKTEVAVGIRALTADTWWPRRGYQVSLSSTKPSGVIEGRRLPVSSLVNAPVPPVVRDTWHQLIVIATGRRVRIRIDGTETAAADIDDRTGVVLFAVEHGTAEFRAISVSDSPFGDGVAKLDFRATPGLQSPKLVKEVKPSYTRQATERRVEGTVEMNAIVEVDGTVSLTQLTKYVDPDLEQTAIYAVRQWRFSPAIENGTPVRIQILIEMTFRLRN